MSSFYEVERNRNQIVKAPKLKITWALYIASLVATEFLLKKIELGIPLNWEPLQ